MKNQMINNDIDIDKVFRSYNKSLPEVDINSINDREMINTILSEAKPVKKKSVVKNTIFDIKFRIATILNSSRDTNLYLLYPSVASIVIVFAVVFLFNQQQNADVYYTEVHRKQAVPEAKEIKPSDPEVVPDEVIIAEQKVTKEKDPEPVLFEIKINQLGFSSNEIFQNSINEAKSILRDKSVKYEEISKTHIVVINKKDTLIVKKEANSIIVKLSNKNNDFLNGITNEIYTSINTIINQ